MRRGFDSHHPLHLQHPARKTQGELLQLCENHGVVAFLAGHTHKLVVNEYKGIQFVNGETTSRNMDNRPRGFRWWDVSAQGKMEHRFVALEGMEE
jgi:predicted phosphodiesterase